MKFNRLISPAKSTPPGVKGMPARDRLEQLEPLLLMSASAHDLDLAEDINPDELSTVASGLEAGAAEALTEFATLSDMDLFDLAATGWPGQLTTDISDRNSDIADGHVEPVLDTEPLREVVFIDSSTPDLNALLVDLQNESDPNREFIAILLDPDRGGIDQITAALSNLDNVAAVHIVSHGSEGRVELGNEILDVGTVSNHLSAIECWANALTSDADILIYGCDLAAAESGRALMQVIAEASGGDVAASDDATGATTQGGDWILEEQVGSVSTKVAFSEELWSTWDHILANYTGTEGADLIEATNGNDFIDGLGGIDTVVYSGNYADYAISGTPDKVIDDQTPGRDGTDTLTNIERAEFLDGIYDLTNDTFSPFVAPSLTTSGLTLTYTENSGPIAIDDQLTLTDADSATLISATVRITGNYDSTQDVLTFTNQSGISGSWDSSTGTLTLTGSTSVANYEAALRSVTYSNTSNAPSTSNRTISITASDAHLSSTAAVRSIAVVATNDAPAGIPTITGLVRENQTLTANTAAISDADGLGAFSYQWLRNGTDIAGATSSTYAAVDADVDGQLSVRIRYTDAFGTLETLTSAQTAAVQNINDVPTGLPLITGTATENQTLTADVSALADIDGLGTISYQWLRDGVAISGATNDSYRLSDADVDAQIRIRVTYTDALGSTEVITSSATDAVANINDALTGQVFLVGNAEQNSTLTVDSSGLRDDDGVGTLQYRWFRDGEEIAGATSASYTLVENDVNARISAKVEYTDDHGTDESANSDSTGRVLNVNDNPVGLPSITGVTTEDQTLTANTDGIRDDDETGEYRFQWLRDGVAVDGAEDATYRLRDEDVGSMISLRVTYTDGHGKIEQLDSVATAAIANVEDAPSVTIVSNQQIDQLRGTGSLQFQVSDVDTQSRFLIVTATSSDLHVVPIENIVLGGIGQFRTIEILPTSTDTQAQTVITVTVSDGTTTTTMSFTVTARGVLTPNNNNGNGSGNSGKGNGNGASYARGNEGNQDEVDALIHANSVKDQKKSSDDDSVQEQKVESERDKNFTERPTETTVQSGKSNRDEPAAPGQQLDSESQNETVIRTEDSATPPAAPRETGSQSPDVILTGVDELSLVPNEVHSAAPTDVEIAVEQSLTADSIEDASSAVLTSVVAVGAMSAIGKGSAVGVLGTSTTTNTYLYVTSKGQLAAAKTFETIVGHMSNLGGTTSSGALMAQHIQSSGAISSGVVTGSSAALATIASTIPIWYSFDPIVILDRFATEYAPLDAAENSGLLSLLSKPV